MTDYIAIIYKDKKSDFGVSFPDFPGCITAGRTIDEAKDMAKEALDLQIEGMREEGLAIPSPSSLECIKANPEYKNADAVMIVEAKEENKTVRVNITLRESDLRQIDAAAERKGMSRSSYLISQAIFNSKVVNSGINTFYDEILFFGEEGQQIVDEAFKEALAKIISNIKSMKNQTPKASRSSN